MDQFTHKTLKTEPEGLTYSYYLSPDFHSKLNPNTPVLQLLHGYPDDAFMWIKAVPILMKLGYPMVIPDLLGFGGSDKPLEPYKYNYKLQANSLAQILDKEGVGNNVIAIGHDWGSATTQRFYLYHKPRVLGVCLISLAYQIPSPKPFDLETANRETEKRFGYPQWEYWNFFCRPDAAELMKKNIQRFYEVNHGNYPSPIPEEKGRDIWMREMFCTPNAMYEYVTGTGRYENYTVPLKECSVPHEEHLPRFIERMSRDGFEGPVNYYHSLKDNTMLEDERALCEKKDGKDQRTIDVPLLFIGQTGDWVCRTDLMIDAVDAGLIDRNNLEEVAVEAGHWCLYEKPEKIAEVLSDWLTRKFPIKQ